MFRIRYSTVESYSFDMDPPGSTVTRVRFEIEGEADSVWRRIYNEVAAGSVPPVPAEALGHGSRTVIIVTVGHDNVPDSEAFPVLSRAAGLIHAADTQRQNEDYRERSALALGRRWIDSMRPGDPSIPPLP